MTILLSATLLFLLACPCAANEEDSDQKKSPEKRYNEAFYQNLWCEEFGGETEVRLPDKTRCDCLTEEYAIEFDFAKKWCEAVGQSLHYARLTEKKAGIVLIIGQDPSKREKDLELLFLCFT